jgi:hypothetical protein
MKILHNLKKNSKRIFLFLFIIFSFSRILFAQTCTDTLVPNTNGYYALCCDMIQFSEKTINISTSAPTGKIDTFDCYKFLFSCKRGNRIVPLPESKDSVIDKLKNNNLFINNKPFTGYLKLSTYLIDNYSGNGSFSGNNIQLFQFNKGVFEKLDVINELIPNYDYQHNAPKKPVLYLYPTKQQEVIVKINLTNHKFTHAYPAYENGWEVKASPDGTLINKATGKEHYCLFWETEGVQMANTLDSGFIVKGSEVSTFLEEKLTQLGLNSKEANEFIIYWLPQMEDNPYNAIYFADTEYEEI